MPSGRVEPVSCHICTIQLSGLVVTRVKHRGGQHGGQGDGEYGTHFGGQGPQGTGGVQIVILQGGGHGKQGGGRGQQATHGGHGGGGQHDEVVPPPYED